MTLEKKALIILAEGAEEMEVVITADVLRRGGVKVTLASLLELKNIKCARNTVIVPDIALESAIGEFDAIILPGGQPGSNTLAASPEVGELLRAQLASGRLIGAICAAPIALKSHGIAVAKVTSHPSVRRAMEDSGYKYSEDRVVVSNNVVTSRGPGTAFEFALKLVEILIGKYESQQLIEPMLLLLP